MRRYFLLLLGLAALSLAGCNSNEGQPAKLKVGTVDVLRVMEGRRETMDIRLEWANQAGEAYLQLSDVRDQAEALALRKEIERRSEVWQKRMDAFMEESINLVEKEASSIARDKGLDIVVVENILTKNVRFTDGEDLTLDVSLRLQKQ
ncbi:MAG: hypothetical protein WC314_10770 [Vulcanimicrobiota bacterium]